MNVPELVTIRADELDRLMGRVAQLEAALHAERTARRQREHQDGNLIG